MTYEQALAEPAEAIEHALFVWSLDAQRDKLEAERQNARHNAPQGPSEP